MNIKITTQDIMDAATEMEIDIEDEKVGKIIWYVEAKLRSHAKVTLEKAIKNADFQERAKTPLAGWFREIKKM